MNTATLNGPVALDDLSDVINGYREASAKIAEFNKGLEEWKIYRGKLRKLIVAAMGDSETGTLDGREIVSYHPRDQFAHALFRKEHSEIAALFMRKEVKEVLDWEALIKAEPELAGPYQTRVFKLDEE